MQTIEQLWLSAGKKKNLKVRYKDWNHRWRYFVIVEFDPTGEFICGHLDCGEKVRYHRHGVHWKLYEEGDEEMARAV